MLFAAPSSVQRLMDSLASSDHCASVLTFHALMTSPVCEEEEKVRKARSGLTSMSVPLTLRIAETRRQPYDCRETGGGRRHGVGALITDYRVGKEIKNKLQKDFTIGAVKYDPIESYLSLVNSKNYKDYISQNPAGESWTQYRNEFKNNVVDSLRGLHLQMLYIC